MKYVKETAKEITSHALAVIEKINEEEVSKLIDTIQDSNCVFIVGTGRSELVGKMFAMRLMHLGFSVHVVGDVTTPAIKGEDCLIAISALAKLKQLYLLLKQRRKLMQKLLE